MILECADYFLWKLYHLTWVIWSPDWPVVVQLSHAWFNLFPHSETWVREWPHEFPTVCPGLSWLGNQRDASCACFSCNKVTPYQSVVDQGPDRAWHFMPAYAYAPVHQSIWNVFPRIYTCCHTSVTQLLLVNTIPLAFSLCCCSCVSIMRCYDTFNCL